MFTALEILKATQLRVYFKILAFSWQEQRNKVQAYYL